MLTKLKFQDYYIIVSKVPQVAFNYVLNEQDPSTNSPSHGTSVAGIVGAAKDNDICGVGIAYEVNLGGNINTHVCVTIMEFICGGLNIKQTLIKFVGRGPIVLFSSLALLVYAWLFICKLRLS